METEMCISLTRARSYVAPSAEYQNGRAWCASSSCCCGPGRGPGGVHDFTGIPSRSRNFEGFTLRCGRDNYAPCVDDYELDSLFFRDMILQLSENFRVNTDKVNVVGLSNGGYMAYRLACDHSDLISGIINICGASTPDVETKCSGASPVHVLHVHGRRDTVVSYNPVRGSLAGAEADVSRWATAFNGCDATVSSTSDYTSVPDNHSWGADLDRVRVRRHENCRGAEAELWTIDSGRGSGHCPLIDFVNLNWLLDKLNVQSIPESPSPPSPDSNGSSPPPSGSTPEPSPPAVSTSPTRTPRQRCFFPFFCFRSRP